MRLRERTVNNGQKQINQEKGTNENHWQEKNERDICIGLLIHDHDIRPALQSHTLEHNQQRIHYVVTISYTKGGILVLFAAKIAFRTSVVTATKVVTIFPVDLYTIFDTHTSFF